MPMRTFVGAIQQAVFNSGMSMEQIAAKMDKKPSTLYNELNPWPNENSTHKLGLEDFVKILEIIGDYSPLTTICNHFNLNSEPRTATPDKPCVDKEMLDDIPALSDYQEAMKNRESVDFVGQQLGRLKDE